jgi:hypothetical protein
MNSIRRMFAPIAFAFAFAAFALVPSVAHAQGMRILKDAQHEKAHDTWIERAGEAVFHFFGLDALLGVDTTGQDSAEARASGSR